MRRGRTRGEPTTPATTTSWSIHPDSACRKRVRYTCLATEGSRSWREGDPAGGGLPGISRRRISSSATSGRYRFFPAIPHRGGDRRSTKTVRSRLAISRTGAFYALQRCWTEPLIQIPHPASSGHAIPRSASAPLLLSTSLHRRKQHRRAQRLGLLLQTTPTATPAAPIFSVLHASMQQPFYRPSSRGRGSTFVVTSAAFG